MRRTFPRASPCLGGVSILVLCWTGLALGAARTRSFDEGWRFLRADAPGAEAPGFDDSRWRIVDAPHDWSIEDLPASIEAQTSDARLDLAHGTWRFRPGDDPSWKAPDFNDADWRSVVTPANWEEHGQSRENNVYGWFRRRKIGRAHV
jgi:beta-galactosidase